MARVRAFFSFIVVASFSLAAFNFYSAFTRRASLEYEYEEDSEEPALAKEVVWKLLRASPESEAGASVVSSLNKEEKRRDLIGGRQIRQHAVSTGLGKGSSGDLSNGGNVTQQMVSPGPTLRTSNHTSLSPELTGRVLSEKQEQGRKVGAGSGDSGGEESREGEKAGLVRTDEKGWSEGEGRDRANSSLFHTAMTCDSSSYIRWQSRIMYYFYKMYRGQEGSGMGGFTRVLHSGKADSLMEEIPTVVVDPLPWSAHKGYVVLNRPWAFVQWLQKAEIEEDFVLMAEPDHVIIRPIPNLATPEHPAAYPFFYITPKNYEKTLRRWYPEDRGPITNIDPVGNSPVIIHKDQLRKLASLWMNISTQFRFDNETNKKFGWVLEMYGYATAAALLGYKHTLVKSLMVQPPWDTQLKNCCIIHFTYGLHYNLKGEHTRDGKGPWHFDKRKFWKPIPRNITLPPEGAAETAVELIRRFNNASATMEWEVPNSTTSVKPKP